VNSFYRHTGLVFAGALAVLFGVAATTAVRASCQTSVAAPVLYARWLSRSAPPHRTEQLLLLAWGGLCAAVLARAVNNTAAPALGRVLDSADAGVLVVAPIVEELLKAAPLVAVVIWQPMAPQRVTIPTTVARGVLVAAGFAAVENVFLVAEAHVSGTGEALRVALVRTAVGPLTHPLFTGLAAIGLALACTAHRQSTRILAPVLGFAAAIGVHAMWNLVTTRAESAMTVLFGGYAALVAIVLVYVSRTRGPKNY
jgi:RsiW-degrading membrane proteinase PrsW (M82 family)